MFAANRLKLGFLLVLALSCTLGIAAQQPVRHVSDNGTHHVTTHNKQQRRRIRHARRVMRNGNSVERRSNGHISDMHDEHRHMDVHNGLRGDRRVSVERADHSRIVAERGRGGYIEHPYAFHGHDYWHRTYWYHGHAYDRFYRGYYFHGIGLRIYAPVRYYPIGFYGWAYHPWHVRVVYAWGWSAAPWYGYYHPYFVPYAVYPGPSAWLTDYMISHDLEAAYAAGEHDEAVAASQPADAPPALSPDVKDLISREVQYDIEVENGEAALDAANKDVDPASSSIARILADGQTHIFVVGAPLDVANEATGDECALSEGDVLKTLDPPGPEDKTASLTVLASKSTKDCAKAVTVTVNLDDLQEMQNHMRETIDLGMEELQQKQGTEGIPALPASAAAPPSTAQFAKLAPPPDPDASTLVDQQQKDADQSEREITAQEAQEPADSNTPAPPPDPAQQPAAPIERKPPQ